MKIPFSIKYRPQIESGEYKVETFSGYPVTIYRWDFDDGAQTPIMGSYVFEDSKEYVGAWNEEGHFDLMSPNDLDLFIITPEPEFTDWETFISGCLQKHGLLDCGAADRIAKECSAELFSIALQKEGLVAMEHMNKACEAEYQSGLADGKNEVMEELKENLANNDIYRVPEWLRDVLLMEKENGKAEALKDLPRWKKATGKERFNERLIVLAGDNDLLCTNYAEEGEYYISFSDIEKLPK